MILAGAPDPIRVNLTADVSRFIDAMGRATAHTVDLNRQIVRTARNMLTLDALLEVFGLSVDQVWATYYVRGGMHPDFAEPDQRDHYLRALLNLKGARGRAAVTGFLAGWTEHRGSQLAPVEAFAWHRYMAGIELQVAVSSEEQAA